jgi:hypothetical protein
MSLFGIAAALFFPWHNIYRAASYLLLKRKEDQEKSQAQKNVKKRGNSYVL